VRRFQIHFDFRRNYRALTAGRCAFRTGQPVDSVRDFEMYPLTLETESSAQVVQWPTSPFARFLSSRNRGELPRGWSEEQSLFEPL
jgi:hypothetical protein